MFTGIVEEIGIVKSINKGQHSVEITIEAKRVLEETKIGDSIAINGICLTVTHLTPTSFSAHIVHETLNRSSLAKLSKGTPVNLERAMAANGRFGGHIVAGHVDGTGEIISIKKDDTSIWYTMAADENILRYIVEKGSITIDGISLTVATIDKNSFSISAIPHTVSQTVLIYRKVGDTVNLETDIIGKYVEKLMNTQPTQQKESTITKDFLVANGF